MRPYGQRVQRLRRDTLWWLHGKRKRAGQRGEEARQASQQATNLAQSAVAALGRRRSILSGPAIGAPLRLRSPTAGGEAGGGGKNRGRGMSAERGEEALSMPAPHMRKPTAGHPPTSWASARAPTAAAAADGPTTLSAMPRVASTEGGGNGKARKMLTRLWRGG